jgi:methylase of polypeptide subunit release factors
MPPAPDGLAVRTLDFDGLPIAWDSRVLEPRPWTAAQSHWAAELAPHLPAGPVLELCCGAGQIGLLTVARCGRDLVAVDLDPAACELTRTNARAAGLGDRVEVREGDLAAVLGPYERFPLVVADPPWVPRAQVGRYPEDPVLAIDGGPDGLDVARHCLAVAERHVAPGGSVVLQLGTSRQAARLSQESPSLAVREVRSGERGVLVRLDAPSR